MNPDDPRNERAHGSIWVKMGIFHPCDSEQLIKFAEHVGRHRKHVRWRVDALVKS